MNEESIHSIRIPNLKSTTHTLTMCSITDFESDGINEISNFESEIYIFYEVEKQMQYKNEPEFVVYSLRVKKVHEVVDDDSYFGHVRVFGPTTTYVFEILGKEEITEEFDYRFLENFQKKWKRKRVLDKLFK